MQDAGWFEKSPNGSADFGDLTPVVPTPAQSGKDGLLVQNKWQELIDEDAKTFQIT